MSMLLNWPQRRRLAPEARSDSPLAGAAEATRAASSTDYRPDIDGLRAVAVSSVVLYHAEIFGLRGGFVGVDIFFVISGYLIGGHILAGRSQGTFSLADFYARRARRILPALFVTILVAGVAGWLLLGASEYKGLGATSASALIATSNISFFRHQDYFAPDARMQPLLMTWSLGVEEQFYIVLPAILFVIVRFWSRRLLLLTGLITLVSFEYSVWATVHTPVAAFYLLPSRAWELGVGVTLAAAELNRARSGGWRIDGQPMAREALGIVGGLAIVASILLFDAATPFPGMLALAPVLGAAAVIAARDSVVNRVVLSSRPFVFVGLISYSFYLWHWPLMSFARLVAAREPPPMAMEAVVLLAFGCGVASWRFVEGPFRRLKASNATTLLAYGAALAVGVIVAFSISRAGGLPFRLSPLGAQVEKDLAEGRGDCLAPFGETRPELTTRCVQAATGAPGVALFGDSHAAALGPGFRTRAAAANRPLGIVTKSACAPVIGVAVRRPDMPHFADECAAFVDRSLSALTARRDLSTVFIAGRWNDYPTLSAEELERGLSATVTLLTRAGKHVVILDDVPAWRFDPAHIGLGAGIGLRRPLMKRLWSDCSEPVPLSGRSNLVLAPNPEIRSALERVATLPGAELVDLRARFCTERECSFARNGRLLFIDHDHLSHIGSALAVSGLTLFHDGPPPQT